MYCISTAKDSDLLDSLHSHTAVWQQSGGLVLQHQKTILAGSENDDDGPVAQAQVVLVLLTKHLWGDADAWPKVCRALARRQQVVPLLARPCDVTNSGLDALRALPRDGKWIEHADNDEAWISVCADLRKLAAELPTPEAAQAVLPPQPRCLGRNDDLRTLVAQLAAPAPSIVLGSADVGKTTLLVTALYDPAVAARYRARRYFVRCDSATTRDGLVLEVAKVLGVPLSPQLEQVVLARLREAPTLLALDNAETPWEADRGPVEDLLTTWAAACKLVLTLRGAERPGHLPFLPALAPRRLEFEDARQVFLAIAGERHSRDPQLDGLIKAVDLLPLALTLLAHRAEPDPDLSSVWADWEELGTAALTRDEGKLDNLDCSLSLSIHGPRMRACPAALRLLTLLGVLPDGIHWDDLDALLPGESREAARTLRRVGLAFDEKPVLKVTALVREHARRCCPPAKADETRAMQRYLTRAEVLGEQVGARGGADASSRLAAESSNIMVVIDRALAQGNDEEALKALNALLGFANFACFSGYRGRVVELLTQAAAQTSDARDQAHCLKRLGDIALERSEFTEARARFDAALSLYEQVRSLMGQANCIRRLGEIALERSGLAEARARFDAAFTLFQQVGSLLGQANCIRSVGRIALERFEFTEARARFNAALPLFQQVDDLLGQANCIKSLGDIALRSADFAEARARFDAALPLFQQVGSLLGQADCIRSLGEIALRHQDFTEARARFDAALPLFQQVGGLLGQAHCINSLGVIALERADHAEARVRFKEALALYQHIPEPYSIGWTQVRLARLCEDPAERRMLAAAAFAGWQSIEREDLVRELADEFPEALKRRPPPMRHRRRS